MLNPNQNRLGIFSGKMKSSLGNFSEKILWEISLGNFSRRKCRQELKWTVNHFVHAGPSSTHCKTEEDRARDKQSGHDRSTTRGIATTSLVHEILHLTRDSRGYCLCFVFICEHKKAGTLSQSMGVNCHGSLTGCRPMTAVSLA